MDTLRKVELKPGVLCATDARDIVLYGNPVTRESASFGPRTLEVQLGAPSSGDARW